MVILREEIGVKMKSSLNKISGFVTWFLYSYTLIYSSVFFNGQQEYQQNKLTVVIFLITVITLLAVIWLSQNKKTAETATLGFMKARPWYFLLTVLFGLIVGFFFFGKTFLYEKTGYWLSSDHINDFFMLCIPIFVYILMSISILDLFKVTIQKKPKDKTSLKDGFSLKIHYLILWIIQIAILGIYFYAFNPGNMSFDTYNQVSQLKGLIPFNTWHPIGHTLLIGLLMKIWDNYAVITIFQIVFFASVTSAFYITLLRNKVKWQIIYVMAIVMSAIPSTGINVVTQWKDIPFTAGLVWGTLVLFKMCMEKNYFSKPLHMFEFIFCVLTIALFRLNGILAFIVMLIFAFVYAVKSYNKIQIRNYAISALVILTAFFMINNVIPAQLNADLNPSGMKLRPIYQGLAAVYVNGAEGDLSIQSRDLIESVCTPDQMQDYYYPYFADILSSNVPEFLINLSAIDTGEALKAYVEAIIVQPKVVIGDKLNLAITMWSVTQDQFSYNNGYTTVIEPEMIEEFGVTRVNNDLTGVIEKIAVGTFYKNDMTNTLIWRPGFYLALEFVLLLYLTIRKDRRICLLIPLICNALVVFLTMPAQDYRYLWFIPFLFPFLVLACSVPLPDEIIDDRKGRNYLD